MVVCLQAPAGYLVMQRLMRDLDILRKLLRAELAYGTEALARVRKWQWKKANTGAEVVFTHTPHTLSVLAYAHVRIAKYAYEKHDK